MAWTLVTGAAKGLGAEISRQLARRKHNVILHYNKSRKEVELVAQSCRQNGVDVALMQGDFATEESTLHFCDELLDQFETTQFLVNNVGNFLVKPAPETTLSDWHALFQNNLYAPIALINALTPSLIRHKGAIVNIGVAGLNNQWSDVYSTAYHAAKTALWTATRAYAKDFLSKGVRVNMISPGYLENAVDLPHDPSALPLGRPAKLAEAAHWVVELLGPDGAYITGQNIEVAGGVRL